MAIKITVGDKDFEQISVPKSPPIKISLQISKLLNNDYYVSAHSLIDIIIQREDGKILVLPKEKLTDQVYEAQNRFFDSLGKQGVIDITTVQGGNLYGSLEGVVLGEEKEVSEQASILAIEKFLEEERPLEELERDIEREQEMKLLLPDDEESTELGEVPHEPTKGTTAMQALNPVGGAYFFYEVKSNTYRSFSKKRSKK